MARTLNLRLDQLTCTAVLNDTVAAMTELLWAALPIQGQLRHVRWSGEAGYVLDDRLKAALPPDGRISMFGPAQIVLRPDHAELAICYGQGQARDGISRGSEACHVATIVGNVDAFLNRVAETRFTGLAPIEITRAEATP